MSDAETARDFANRCPNASRDRSVSSSIKPFTAITQPCAANAYDLLRITMIYAAISAVAVGLYLTSPKPEGRYFCGQTVQLGRHLSFPLNCDSMEFIDDAISPSSLLKAGSERQDRPLFVAAAAIPTQLLIQSRFWRIIPERFYASIAASPAFSAHYLKHHVSTTWSVYAKYSLCAYVSYIALNGVIVLAALLLFHWLTTITWEANGIVIAFGSLLLANDVVKAFFWSPHTQMLNLVIPLGAVLVCDSFLRVPTRSIGYMWTVGFAIGILTLAYGSFPVWVLAGMLGLAIRLFSKEIHISLLRFCTQSLALVTGLALPSGIWIALCHVVAGGYHNRELAVYHQFIWIWESYHLGWSQLLTAATSNLVQFLAVLLPVLYFPVLLLVGIVVVGRSLRVPIGLVVRERSTTFVAIAISTSVCLVYFYFLGTYRERLALNIVLPLLLASAIVAIGILERVPRPLAALMVQLSIWILIVARFAYEISKAGPWSS